MADKIFLNNLPVDMIAYYPYQPTLLGDYYPVDLSNQSNQKMINILYSNNAKNGFIAIGYLLYFN